MSKADSGTYQIPDFAPLEPEERLGEIEAVLDKARDEGILNPLAEDECDTEAIVTGDPRLGIVRTRLHILGYMRFNSQKAVFDEPLRQALIAFQKDLPHSEELGWIGPHTWHALQSLVSFEIPLAAAQWFADGAPSPALQRATQLRLQVLGFVRRRPGRNPPRNLNPALLDFVRLASILKLKENRLEATMNPSTLDVLFDQDLMIKRLAANLDSFQVDLPGDIDKEEARKRLKSFIVCQARIELWLVGYDLRIDGDPRFPDNENAPLRRALTRFWIDTGESWTRAEFLSKMITGRFFRKILDMQTEADSEPDDEHAANLGEWFNGKPKDVLDQVWTQYRSLGSRLWDGLKRAWHWFKTFFNKGLEATKNLASNIARLTHYYALKAYRTLRLLFKNMDSFFQYWFTNPIQGSNPSQLVIARAGDLDLNVYVNMKSDEEEVQQVLGNVEEHASFMQRAGQMVGIFFSILVTVIRAPFQGGWLGLLIALVKVFKKFRELGGLLKPDLNLLDTTL